MTAGDGGATHKRPLREKDLYTPQIPIYVIVYRPNFIPDKYTRDLIGTKTVGYEIENRNDPDVLGSFYW